MGIIATVPIQARHKACRQSAWDDAGKNITEHRAGLEDFEAGEATYQLAMTKSVTIQDRQDGV
jgi:hypothetical protein